MRMAYRCRAYPDPEQQRVSTRLVRDHDLIVIEDLNVKGMTANRRLAKAIRDCGWGTRTWACPVCGARHDRDHNAAKNILAAGLALSACGADISHPGSSRVQSALKQEPQRATAGIPALQGRE